MQFKGHKSTCTCKEEGKYVTHCDQERRIWCMHFAVIVSLQQVEPKLEHLQLCQVPVLLLSYPQTTFVNFAASYFDIMLRTQNYPKP